LREVCIIFGEVQIMASPIDPSEGGKARAGALSAERRSEIAKQAAEARWSETGASKLPKENYEGILKVRTIELPCGVLDDGTRILSTRGVNRALGSAGTGTSKKGKIGARQLPAILASDKLKPYLTNELIVRLTHPREYRPKHGGRTAYGHEATLLPEMCEVIIEADRAGVLGKRYENISRTADLLIRGFARVGIIALIDEATGYQDDRAKDELTRILEAYIEESLRPYVSKFSNDFFKEIYRLYGWTYKPGSNFRPQYIGKFINKYIYEPLPPSVLTRLRELNPVTEKGYRRHKHFQLLTENVGEPHLDKQLAATTALLKISDSVPMFDDHFRRAFAKHYQNKLQFPEPLIVEVE
jgi:P63C domain-containing protein